MQSQSKVEHKSKGKQKRRTSPSSIPPEQETQQEADLIHHTEDVPPRAFNRYYHMFSSGELTSLVHDAAEELGLFVGAEASGGPTSGLEIVQDGLERSNYYVELKLWQIRI